ncbi:MAG: hypothetical protein M1829_005278 [Trizodia sp. TS-e1964]|nr:MAG: hypothetical protein M1829_005278 [Trizodia sp. TS-e1964]
MECPEDSTSPPAQDSISPAAPSLSPLAPAADTPAPKAEPVTGSPLLDLPREIRLRIYKYVFDDVIVHLEKDDYYLRWKARPRMALCVGNIHVVGYKVPARLAGTGLKAQCRVAGWEPDRHPTSKMLGIDKEKSALIWTNQHNLSAALLVCRKMRKEARPIFYSTLTFHVEPDFIWEHSTRMTLINFRRTLKKQDRMAIRRLSLQWSVYDRDMKNLPGTLGGTGDVIAQLPSLHLFSGLRELWFELVFSMRMPKMDMEEVWVKRLMGKLCGLKLKTGRIWLHHLVERDLTQIYAFGDELSKIMMASSTYVEGVSK